MSKIPCAKRVGVQSLQAQQAQQAQQDAQEHREHRKHRKRSAEEQGNHRTHGTWYCCTTHGTQSNANGRAFTAVIGAAGKEQQATSNNQDVDLAFSINVVVKDEGTTGNQ